MENVVLVTIDALRYDYLKDELNNLPNLKRIYDESYFFEKCFANAPWTAPSFLSIFTGKLSSNFKKLKIKSVARALRLDQAVT